MIGKAVLTVLCLFFIIPTLQAGAPTGRYLKIVNQMQQLQTDFPNLVKVFSIGTNDDDVEIYAMRMSLTPNVSDPNKVAHLIVSTHHGNESAAPVFTMHYINKLLDTFRSPLLWRGDFAETEWIVVPVLNISGYNAYERREHNIDPNRDYPTPCAKNTKRLKSVRQVMKLMGQRVYSGTVTVHGYYGSLTFPWGMYTDKDETLDHNYYQQITEKAAEHNNYSVGTHQLLYPANGSYEDYAYYAYGMWTLLLELRSGNQTDIQNTGRAIFSFFEQLNATPSTQNEFLGNCTAEDRIDLRIE